MLRKVAHLSVGLLPLGLGFAVLVGALAEPSRFALGFPGVRSIGINAALCYVAVGVAFLCHPFASSLIGGRALKALGLAVVFCAAAVLFQWAFHFYPAGGFWRVLLNTQFPRWDQWGGGMSLTGAIGFLSLGIVLINLDRIRGPRYGLALLALAAVALFLSTMGAVGQLMGVDLLFSDSSGSLLMGGPSSWAMGVASGGVIYLLVRGAWFKKLFLGREDRRIFFANVVFLFMLTLVSGLIGIGLLERETVRSYQNILSDAVVGKAQLFENRIMRAITGVTTATVLSGVDDILAKPDGPARKEGLREISQELLRKLWLDGVRMVRLSDRDGQIWAEAGEAAELPSPGLPVAFPNPVRLYWMNGWWVEIQVLLVDGFRPVGRAQFQVRLTGLDMPLSHTRGVGDVGGVRVCATGTGGPLCVSDFVVPEHLGRSMAAASLALSGSQGVEMQRGPEGDMMAAYTPIGSTGLGMVNEVYTRELFHGLRVKLLWALSAIACVILAGAFAFYRRVYPMVREIQFEKTRIQEVMRHIPEGVITLDGNGAIEATNPAMERLFGYTVPEMRGRGISDLIPRVCNMGKDGRTEETFVWDGGRAWGELTGVRRDGSRFPVELAFNSFALDGKRYFIGMVRDVTERKKAEEALHSSVSLLRNVLQTLPVGVWVLDAEGEPLLVNGVGREICPCSDQIGITGYGDFEGYHLDTGKRLSVDEWPIVRALRQGEQVDGEVYRLNCGAESRYVRISAAPLRDEKTGRNGAIAVVKDVSQQWHAEEALRRSEEQYRTMLETTMDGFFVADGSGRFQGANSTFCRLLRYGEPEAMQNLSFADIGASETWDDIQSRLGPGRSKKEDRFESRVRRKDGRVLDVEVSVRYQPEEDLFFCFMRDITKRKRAENALKRSLASLADAQRIARIGDWDWEISNDTLVWSEEAYRIFGLEPHELVGSLEGFLCRVYPDDRERVTQAIHAALNERRPYSLDHRIVRPDGSIRVVHELAEVVFDKKWRPLRMRGTMQDITERKRIEEDLLHSRTLLRKLAAHIETVRENEKGRIAREIHDELGQLLTALRMDVSLVRIQFAGEQPALKEKLEAMTDLVDRTIRVVRSVASNLRPSALEVGIVPAIEWLVEDFQKRSGIMIHFKRFDRDLELDERREIAVFRIMQESLTNIARYANASRVEITVAKLKGVFLWVEVQDNGKGFELDKLPPHKAFGLMGIRERALSLSGECIIDSAPGSGTTISVQLPLDTLV